MNGNVIEMRPGISLLDFSREPMGPPTPAIDLTQPEMQLAVLKECREYALDVHAKMYLRVSDTDLAKAANLCKSLATIIEALAAARLAARATAMARDVDAACRAALEAAERI